MPPEYVLSRRDILGAVPGVSLLAHLAGTSSHAGRVYSVQFDVSDSSNVELMGRYRLLNLHPPFLPFKGTAQEIRNEYQRLMEIGLIPPLPLAEGHIDGLVESLSTNPRFLSSNSEFQPTIMQDGGSVKLIYIQPGTDVLPLINLQFRGTHDENGRIIPKTLELLHISYSGQEIYLAPFMESVALQIGEPDYREVGLVPMDSNDTSTVHNLDVRGIRRRLLGALKSQKITLK